MRPLFTIIIDDQQSAIDQLLGLLEDVMHVVVVGTFTNEREARRFLVDNQVDFIILDVELQRTTAFSFLQLLPNPRIPTILYTGFQKYEDRGYDIDVVDVLLKPVTASRLLGAIRRVHRLLGDTIEAEEENLETYYHYFQLKGPVRGGRQMVRLREILYVATEGGKVIIHLVGGEQLICAHTFKSVIAKLPKKWFKQCYQNIVFNINFYAAYREKQVFLTVSDRPLPTGSRELYGDFYTFLETNVLEG